MELTDDQLGGLFVLLWFSIVSAGCAICFQKASQPVWPAFVPVLNAVHLCRLSGTSPWLVLSVFVPLVNMLAPLYVAIKLAKRFGWPEVTGIAVWISGFLLLPILALRRYENCEIVEAQLVSGGENTVMPNLQQASQPQDAHAFSRIRMIVLTVGYLMGLMCFPGIMVVGVMAFGGASSEQVERSHLIVALFALTPVSLLVALIGGWVLHANRKYWAASSLAVLPVLNAFAVVGSFIWVMSR